MRTPRKRTPPTPRHGTTPAQCARSSTPSPHHRDELTTALRDKTLEADDVEILRRDPKRVARIRRDDLRRAQRPPQLRNRRLQRIDRIARRRVAPQLADETVSANRLTPMKRKNRHERSQLRPADHHRRSVISHGLELAEQTHLHVLTVLTVTPTRTGTPGHDGVRPDLFTVPGRWYGSRPAGGSST